MSTAQYVSTRLTPMIWLVVASLVGFSISWIFSSVLEWKRPLFVIPYFALAGSFLALFFWRARIPVLVRLRRHWLQGLVVGLLVGLILARAVMAQAPSPQPEGIQLVAALLWFVLVYGLIDALFLNIMPVLAIYELRPPASPTACKTTVQRGSIALVASLCITAAYHFGYTEFRGADLLQPLIGNAIITLAYLITGSPLAAVISHIIMHFAAVIHGMETTVQLPPHY